jgi:hypothetical protein
MSSVKHRVTPGGKKARQSSAYERLVKHLSDKIQSHASNHGIKTTAEAIKEANFESHDKTQRAELVHLKELMS